MNTLPNTFQQVEYIESTGTQYIDTGINADSKLQTIIDIQYTDISNSNNTNFGAIKAEPVIIRYHIMVRYSTFSVWLKGTENAFPNISADLNRHLFNLDVPNGKLALDNSEISFTLEAFDTELNFWLFARNSDWQSAIYYNKSKLYRCKMIYDGTIVRDFVPCYRKSDNTIGLYDVINNVFYTNNGTGTFIKGNNVTVADKLSYLRETKEQIKDRINFLTGEITDKTPFRDYTVVLDNLYNELPKTNTIENNSVTINGTKAGKVAIAPKGNVIQNKLPSAYQQVEYIESTGTQYIDTGVKANGQKTDYEITFESTRNAAYMAILSARQSSSSNRFDLLWGDGNPATLFVGYNTNSRYINNYYANTKTTIIKNGSAIYRNGTKEFDLTLAAFETPVNLYLFANNNNGTVANYAEAKLYRLRLYNDNVLIRDFMPCYRRSDYEIGLYDLVNGEFYTNQGTGTFLIGKNLLNVNVKGDNTSGVTKTVENQAITFNGQATTGHKFDLTTDNIVTPAGQYTVSVEEISGTATLLHPDTNQNYYFIVSFGSSIDAQIKPNQKNVTVTLPNDYNGKPFIWIGYPAVGATASFENYKFKVQIESGSTATAYEDYHRNTTNPNPEFKEEVKVVSGNNTINYQGKNLSEIDRSDNEDNPTTRSGLTYYYNRNTITVTGENTATATGQSFIFKKKFPAGTYTISGLPNKEVGNNDRGTIYIWTTTTPNAGLSNADDTQTSVYYKKTITISQEAYIGFRIISNNSSTGIQYNQTYNIQIESGTESHDFETALRTFPLDLIGKNKFNLNTITENTYIQENGNTGSSSVTNLSDYILVKSSVDYGLSFDFTTLLNTNVRSYCYYDANKNYISGASYNPSNKTATFSVPNNASYIRFGYDKNCYNIQLEEGTATEYEPYYNYELAKVQDINLVNDNKLVPSTKIATVKNKLVTSEPITSSSSAGCLIEFPNFTPEVGDYYVSADIRLKSGTCDSLSNVQMWARGTWTASASWTRNPAISNEFQNYIRKYTISDAGDVSNLVYAFYVQLSNPNNAVLEFKNIQISKTNVDYIPYGTNSDLIFKNEIANPYYDNTLIENAWYKKEKIGKRILNGTETWGKSGDIFYCSSISDYNRNNNVPYSDYFIGDINKSSVGDTFIDNSMAFNKSTSNNRLYIRADSIDGITTWLAEHNTTVYYLKDNPTNIQITETDLINQLEELNKVIGTGGTITIHTESESNNAPLIISASALAPFEN